MKKSTKFAVIVCLLAALLSGCGMRIPEDNGSGLRMVVGITVHYENGPLQAQRLYTSADKMQTVLNYLRLLDPYGTPQEDPEGIPGSSYVITLYYSDGSEKDYRQKSDRYMSEGGGSWKKIDPSKAEELARIMGRLESDELA